MSKRIGWSLFACLAVVLPGSALAQDQTADLFHHTHALGEIVRINAKGCDGTLADAKAYRAKNLDVFKRAKTSTKTWLGKVDAKGQKAYMERNKSQIMRYATESAGALDRFGKACPKQSTAVRMIFEDFNLN